jgi:thiamine-phosphate pyrophosphorylase
MARQFGNAADSLVSNDEYLERLMDAAVEAFRVDTNQPEVQSEHLLFGLLQVDSPIAQKLTKLGLTTVSVREFFAEESSELPPIEVDFLLGADSTLPGSEPGSEPGVTACRPEINSPNATTPDSLSIAASASADVAVLRIIDAAANRLREGLRVLDDYVRFVLNDPQLTDRIKQLRHRSADSCRRISPGQLRQARNTAGDIGTSIHTSTELNRESLNDVVIANLKRTQESARSLEEFGKLIHPEFALEMKQLRYELYILESSFPGSPTVAAESPPSKSIADCRLYVLVTENGCRSDWRNVVQDAISNGADVIQLREKHLPDRELIHRARWVRQATLGTGSLFIMNDRADIAAMVNADGVHVGQDEASVTDVRSIVGRNCLVGVSTHSIEQARQAVADGADYIGIGPVFPSTTKSFESFAGREFVGQAEHEISIPGFSIGGITPDNLGSLLAAGAKRIAVSGSVCGANDAAQATAQLKARMTPTDDR